MLGSDLNGHTRPHVMLGSDLNGARNMWPNTIITGHGIQQTFVACGIITRHK